MSGRVSELLPVWLIMPLPGTVGGRSGLALIGLSSNVQSLFPDPYPLPSGPPVYAGSSVTCPLLLVLCQDMDCTV